MKNKNLQAYFSLLILFLVVSMNAFGQTNPFPQNKVYSFGLMPSNRSGVDAQNNYNTWKKNFVTACSNGRYRVKFDDPNQTVSEGIGYGMLLSAYAGDKTLFDGFWNYYKDNRNNHGVMNWKINGCSGTIGANGATDADVDAAMALIVAHMQWGSTGSVNYQADAKALISAIKANEVESGSNVLKPGDVFGGSDNTNPSYFAPGYFRVFATFNNDASWNAVADKCYDVINKNLSVHNAAGGLVSDWCKADGNYSAGQNYSYDAARTPWRIAVDYVWHGTTNAKTYSKKSSDFVRVNLGGSQNVKDGYSQNGSTIGQWHNSTFTGGFAAAAMGGDVQAHLDNSYSDLKGINDAGSYFNQTLKTLYLFLLSGNFYLPGGGTPPPVITQSPYSGTATGIPGRIEAEKYDNGGNSVVYNDGTAGNSGAVFRSDDVDIEASTDAGAGYNVGWTAAGEWLEYTVNVSVAGKYDFKARVASTLAGKSFHIEMNNANVTGTITVPNTGGWQTWQTVTVSGITLSAGTQVMKIFMDTDGFNLNYIDVLSSVTTPTNQSPSVSITSPGNNASFTAPATITINANASDNDGTVSKVEFYNGSTLLGTDVTAPYSFVWNSVAAGSYTINAKATDNSGAVTSSSSVAITVTTTTPPTGCPVNAVPPAAQWTVRNDWADQNNGSGVANTTDALNVKHRQWGRNFLWAIESGKTMILVSGQTYTIKFDFRNDASAPVSSVDVGFASAFDWSGATLAQPTVSTSGFSSSSFTTKTVTITATSNATVNLLFKLNWPAQPGVAVNTYIKNISVCSGTSAAKMAVADVSSSAENIFEGTYNATPNPFEGQTVIKINESMDTPMKLSVTSISGRVVYESATHYTNEEINFGNELSQGLYVVQANYLGKVVTFKLVKN
jgi:endo-1,4-beta-D-glucanase Y